MKQDVVIGVIRDNSNRVLIAKRSQQGPEAGLWEFPGGKVEAGESLFAALKRELSEEIGIDIFSAQPRITLNKGCNSKQLTLHIWDIIHFRKSPCGNEGQPISWQPLNKAQEKKIPEINKIIFKSLLLPTVYLITPLVEKNNLSHFIASFKLSLIINKIRLARFRQNNLSDIEYTAVAKDLLDIAKKNGCQLLLDDVNTAMELGADGVHLSELKCLKLTKRPIPKSKLLIVSCHNQRQVIHANALGVDALTISPIMPTATHPGCYCIGWNQLKYLAAYANVPVYALGGLRLSDVYGARSCNAQGIAAIRDLWCYARS